MHIGSQTFLPSPINLPCESSEKASDSSSLPRAKACHTSAPHSTRTSSQGLGSPCMASAHTFCHKNEGRKGEKFPHFTLKKIVFTSPLPQLAIKDFDGPSFYNRQQFCPYLICSSPKLQ